MARRQECDAMDRLAIVLSAVVFVACLPLNHATNYATNSAAPLTPIDGFTPSWPLPPTAAASTPCWTVKLQSLSNHHCAPGSPGRPGHHLVTRLA